MIDAIKRFLKFGDKPGQREHEQLVAAVEANVRALAPAQRVLREKIPDQEYFAAEALLGPVMREIGRNLETDTFDS